MNRLLRDGRESGTALGAWVKLPSTESCEIFSDAGFDFVVVDLEHTLMDLSQAYAHIVVATSLGLRVLVRLPDATSSLVQRVLDAGADGVVAPHIDDPEAAARMVASSRFPTGGGTRGSGSTSRAGRWAARSRGDYLGQSPLVVAQAESASAVDHADAIAATDGLAAVMLGPADLGLDPRVSGGEMDPAAAADKVQAAARRTGILAGTACPAAAAPDAVRRGYDFVIFGNDVTMLAGAAAHAINHLRDSVADASTPRGRGDS